MNTAEKIEDKTNRVMAFTLAKRHYLKCAVCEGAFIEEQNVIQLVRTCKTGNVLFKLLQLTKNTFLPSNAN